VRYAGRGLVLVLLAALGAGVSGCARTAPPVELRFWAMGRESEVLQTLMPQFEREHPGIRVRIEQLPWTAAHAKLLTAVAGDSTPDLCQLGNTWVAELADLDALEPLDAALVADRQIPSEDYFAGIWATNRIGTSQYGVPWYVDTRLLFYRKDLVAAAGYREVPSDWAGFKALLKAIRVQSHGQRYGILLPLNEYEPLLALGLQSTTPLLKDRATRGNFSNADFVAAFDYYISLFDEGLAPPVTNSQISNVWNEFARGYFAFYITGPWNLGEFRRRLPPELDGAWGTAPLPGPVGPGASIAGGASLALFKHSRHKPEAWALIEYLSRPDVQESFYRLTGDLPARRSVWATGSVRDDPRAAAFKEQLERVRPAPPVAEWEEIMTEMRLVAEHVVRHEMTPAEGAAELDRRADRMLAKRRELVLAGRLR
jgi:multiple sugar transport system substrate-binding protein